MGRARVRVLLLLVFLLRPDHLAAAPCSSSEGAEQIAPGLEHRVVCKGEPPSQPGFRARIGVFERQPEADQLFGALGRAGFPAVPESDGKQYSLFTPRFTSREEVEAMRKRLVAAGFPCEPEVLEIQGGAMPAVGPWEIHVLLADPRRIELRVAHAFDAAIGLETTTELAARHGALAAINGGYFRMEGLLAGDCQGVLKIGGQLLSEPDRGRAAVGFFEHEGAVRAVFGRLGFRAEIGLAQGGAIPLDGINRQREAAEVILFTPEFHRTTLTPLGGAEIVVQDGRTSEIRAHAGSSLIPADGLVLSIGPEKAGELVPRFELGGRVSILAELLPLLPDPQGLWARATSIVGGGPLLIWQGRVLDDAAKESISRVFVLARHPRTAIAVRKDGTLLFVTVDGRRPGESVGMSLPELSELLLQLGSEYAINLDGGGSTTMVIGGRTVNTPSGSSGARRTADAILLFAKGQ